MDRLTRKELKSDKFALEVQHSVEYVSEHRRQLIRWGGAAVAALVVVFSIYLYLQHEHSVRAEALAQAMRIQNAAIGPQQNEYNLTFPTDADRTKAAVKAFTDIAARFSGSDEGAVAEFFLAANAADHGQVAEAEKRFREVADSGRPYSTLAKLSLAQLLAGEGKTPEARKLAQSVVDRPNVLVSKDAATIVLAQIIAPSQPQEARKLLEPLRGSTRSAVSRTAITALSDLAPK